jgi:tetratricopeptide (TPR) repeat protein
MTAQGIAKHRNEILRLRLGLKDPCLPCLPWEVLHTGDRPLTTGTDVVFCRYHSGSVAMTSHSLLQQSALWEPDQSLRILMVLSAPTDQEILALKQEAIHLQEELQRATRSGVASRQFANIELTILDQPGREQLTQALEHHHYHVLHYAGHSNLGTEGGNLYLVSNKTGLTEMLSGDDLAGLLVNNGIRMVVFNSCRGVYTAAIDPLLDNVGDGNLADALVRRGIPVVLAMAERIPDEVALNLSRLFYRNLKQALPVDLSLNRVRQSLISSYTSQQLYWALPILYMHPEFDGYLQPATTNGNGNDNDNSNGNSNGNGDRTLLTTEPTQAADKLAAIPNSNQLAGVLPDAWDDTLNPDDLEFEDLEQAAEMETVAQLVQQLSQTSMSEQQQASPLPASASENLLPDAVTQTGHQNYLRLPENPRYPTTSEADRTNPVTPSIATPVARRVSNQALHQTDVQVYSELEQLLADTGKLTDAIAACNRAIQVNPSDAEAYYNLGVALHQQGYLAEAISTYHQALQFNPQLAHVHNRLGLALQQQGNLLEAIRAYSQAIQLNPELVEAHQNLSIALHKKGITQESGLYRQSSTGQESQGTGSNSAVRTEAASSIASGTATLPSPFPPPITRQTWISFHRFPLKPLLWAGAGATSILTLLLGIWFFSDVSRRLSFNPFSPQQEAASPQPFATDLAPISTNTVATLATEQLSQGNFADAQKTVEALLDRGALREAQAVLASLPNRYTDNPTANFLRGRLTWQLVKQGEKDFSLDDARRFWEFASKGENSAQIYNALGFAYYAEGKLAPARQQWLKTLELKGERGSLPRMMPANQSLTVNQSLDPDTLTAYAGLALITMKRASKQPPTQRGKLTMEAIDLRQKVLTNDPVNFQADALAKNWLWSEQAIADWRTLLTLK